jgi:hypothetical protein
MCQWRVEGHPQAPGVHARHPWRESCIARRRMELAEMGWRSHSSIYSSAGKKKNGAGGDGLAFSL